jgi:multidrug efflux pump subunit AcrA (membrane-fusion protein)
VVADDGSVSARSVVAGGTNGDMRVIESGLQAGEKVIVDNLGKLRPGMKVAIKASGA